jgi:hypothetical protein
VGDDARPTGDGDDTASASGSDGGGGPPGDDGGDGGDGPPGDGGDGDDDDDDEVDPDHVRALAAELQATREELDDLEDRVDTKTVHRDDIAAELKRYVRARQRRGHATGWGPYIVLLYGTLMTLGAFYYLGGVWALASMLVVWLSTLGLYVVMLFVGMFVGAGRKLGSLRDLVGGLR